MRKYVIFTGLMLALMPANSLWAELSAGAEGWNAGQDSYLEEKVLQERFLLAEDLQIEDSSTGLPPLEDDQITELAVKELTGSEDPELEALVRDVFE